MKELSPKDTEAFHRIAETRLSGINHDTIFVHPIKSIPYTRVKDTLMAFNLECVVRTYFPHEHHLFGITEHKIHAHEPIINTSGDTVSAYSLAQLNILKQVLFDHDWSSLDTIDQMPARFPIEAYATPDIWQFANADTIFEFLQKQYEKRTRTLLWAIITIAIETQQDDIAEEILNRYPDDENLIGVYDTAMIWRESYLKRKDVLERLRTYFLQKPIPQDERKIYYFHHLNDITHAIIDHAIDVADARRLFSEIHAPTNPMMKIHHAFHALRYARESQSPLLDPVISDMHTLFMTAPIDLAPLQHRDEGLLLEENQSSYADKRIFITQMMYLIEYLADIGGYQTHIDQYIERIAGFLHDSDVIPLFDDILFSLGIAGQFETLDAWYALMKEQIGASVTEKLHQTYLFARYKHDTTQPIIEPTLIDHLDEIPDLGIYQDQWYSTLVQQFWHNPLANTQDLIATMDRIDQMVASQWDKTYPLDTSKFAAAGYHFFGDEPNFYKPRLPQLLLEIADDALEHGRLDEAKQYLSDHRLSEEKKIQAVFFLVEYIYENRFSTLNAI